MSLPINNHLSSFKVFLKENSKNLDLNVKFDGQDPVKKVKLGSKVCAISRAIGLTNDAKIAIAENNRVREIFLKSILSYCKADKFEDLDPTIKAAFRGTHASTDDGDFAFDNDGHVTSGKPLTLRRIKAVLDAIEAKDKTIEKSKPLVSNDVVEKRTNLLTTVYANYALDRLTAERTDDKDPIVLQGYQKDNAKRHIEYIMKGLAKFNSVNDSTSSLQRIRNHFTSLIANGIGINPTCWASGTTTINGITIRNCDLREQEVRQIFDDIVDKFNNEHPDLKL